VDLLPVDPGSAAAQLWADLDEPWREAFRQAWDAFRTGNVAVGACASTADGEIVHAARNRIHDDDAPPGEVFGSVLAHAEVNVLARLPSGSPRNLVLTTTLEPCLQCAGAIRLGPIRTVRFAGQDSYWAGCHEFGKLSPREAQRIQPARTGPRYDELGTFAILIARFGQQLTPGFEQAVRAAGEGPVFDLVGELKNSREADRLAAMEVEEAVRYLWPRLQRLAATLS
jgi:tRNA(Arg) A34 adenosine deaminase TadA